MIEPAAKKFVTQSDHHVPSVHHRILSLPSQATTVSHQNMLYTMSEEDVVAQINAHLHEIYFNGSVPATDADVKEFSQYHNGSMPSFPIDPPHGQHLCTPLFAPLPQDDSSEFPRDLVKDFVAEHGEQTGKMLVKGPQMKLGLERQNDQSNYGVTDMAEALHGLQARFYQWVGHRKMEDRWGKKTDREVISIPS